MYSPSKFGETSSGQPKNQDLPFCGSTKGAVMRIVAYILACFGFLEGAYAKPVTLICNGSLTVDGKQVNVGGETAILDLEKQSFKPPLYPEFPLIRISENDLSFGSELQTVST
jgi:hypothetical protein